MIPRYERRGGGLLNSGKEGSAEAVGESSPPGPENSNESPDGSPKRQDMGHPPSTREESPDSLPGGHRRIAAMPPIVLGKEMADNLGAKVGDVVLVTSPQGELTPFGVVPKYSRFHVVGIFNSGFFDYDSSWAFARLSDAQKLFGLGDLISVIEFKLDDIYAASNVARQLEQTAGHGFMATSWMEQNKALFHALRLERLVTFITVWLIVFVAAPNILISLTMMVMEKTKNIAVPM